METQEKRDVNAQSIEPEKDSKVILEKDFIPEKVDAAFKEFGD